MVELLESAQLYDRLFDQICVVDSDQLILYANKSFLTFAQMDKLELNQALFSEWIKLNFLKEEDHPFAQCRLKKKYVGLREMEGTLKNGSSFSILMGVQPLYESQKEHEPNAFLVSIQDKSLEQQLHVKYKRVIDKIESDFNESVRVFANITDTIEFGNRGFGVMVSTLARRIADQMGMDEKEARKVEVAGRLHAIGTLGMRQSILEKKYIEMTKSEKKEYEKYPILGGLVFDGIESFKEVCDYIETHREHYDGKGFPKKLTGSQLPLGGQILHLAYDFMSLEESKGKQSTQDLLPQMLKLKSISYHPMVVDAFMEVVSTQSHFIQRMERKTIELSELRAGMTLASNLRSGKGVLLMQAEEKVNLSSLNRLHRFNENDPILDEVEIYSAVDTEELVTRLKEAKLKGKRKILVVDDTIELNMLLCLMINKCESMLAEGVYSGKEALEVLSKNTYDAVLLDVMMPEMTGLEVLARIRESSPRLPVVMCTAKSEQADVVEALRLGADDYLKKPIQKEPLQEALTSLLNKYQNVVDYKAVRRDQMTNILKKVAPEFLLKKEDSPKLKLSVKFRQMRGGESWGETLLGEAEELTRIGFSFHCKNVSLNMGDRITFALQNHAEQTLLLAGVGVVRKHDLEVQDCAYKVDFISVRKPG